MKQGAAEESEVDVAVIGGGTGGCAAALRAARMGWSVVLTEETDWIGGQLTAQGVSALDEHRTIEEFGGTASYYELRDGIRAHYRTRYELAPEAAANPRLNPGNGWVSRLCFEPRAGVAVLEAMLAPQEEAGRLRILRERAPIAAEVEGDQIRAVLVQNPDGRATRIRARYFLDATELGDLLPLVGAEHVAGSESRAETGEPHAPEVGNPEWAQSFTFPFAVELCPGGDYTIARPEGYERFRESQPYTLTVDYGAPKGLVRYHVFDTGPGTFGPFWTYRRLIDRANFRDERFPNDIAMINWTANDFAGGNVAIRDAAGRAELFRQARLLSLGFLYYLQTEVPRDDGGRGYPEFRLRAEVMGTDDGLAKFPYIREALRIRALRTVVETDISADYNAGARAAVFADSVGIGLYSIDIHACAGNQPQVIAGARPFQVPLGALVPIRLRNLLPAAKNLGTTHITNGAYRVHPAEWAIGEAAGALAGFCLSEGVSPHQVAAHEGTTRRLQRLLIRCGMPLYWYEDVPLSHPAFTGVQWLAVTGVWPGAGDHLRFEPDAPFVPDAPGVPQPQVPVEPAGMARGECAMRLAERLGWVMG